MSRCFNLGLLMSVFVVFTIICMDVGADKHQRDTKPRHVIIVGGGLAGLTAVLEAVSLGARVTLVEGEKDSGGNSAKSSSGINGCGTTAQKTMNIEDSVELFIADTMKAGHGTNKADLVDRLVRDSADAVQFLITYGTNLSAINLLGGHSLPRTHWLPSPKEGKAKPIGVTVMSELKSHTLAVFQLFGSDTIHILMKTEARRLLVGSDGQVIGVEVQTEGDQSATTILGDAVILATGGFSNDRDGEESLLKEFSPSSLDYPTTNGPFARGSGVKMARKIGANLIGMDKVQLHPTGFVDPKAPQAYTKFLAAEALRGMGGILLNQQGRRFANELGARDYLTEEILDKCSKNETAGGARTAYLIMNEEAVGKFGWPAFNFYWKVKGFFQKVSNVDEFGSVTGVPAENIGGTFSAYSLAASSGKDEYGKTVFPVLFNPSDPLYFSTITPSVHYTMGGLEIDPEARVLQAKDGKPIPGLYAAGEVAGGVHGDNRLGGNSLLECVVFGRVAARNAAMGHSAGSPRGSDQDKEKVEL